MSGKLEQLNISYIAKEDRLLLKIRIGRNTEYRIWLTRRFTDLLLNHLNEKMQEFGGAEVLAVDKDTQKEVKGGALEKKYEEPDAPEYPFGENGFIACQLKSGKDKANNLQLQILPEHGKGLTMSVNRKLLFMLQNLLVQGINHANWNLQYSNSLPQNIH